MGDSVKIYLGPVISIKSQKQTSEKNIVCPEGHKNQNGNFCSVCGSKMVEQTVKYAENVKTWDVEDGDDLFFETEDYPNQWMTYNFNLIKDTNENSVYGVNITPEIIQETIDNFKSNPQIEIALKELDDLKIEYSINFKMLSYWY